MSDFVASTVPANGLALIGGELSAGTIMSKFGSCIFGELARKLHIVRCRYNAVQYDMIERIEKTAKD